MSATGLRSFSSTILSFLGTGISSEFFQDSGMTERESDKLRIYLYIKVESRVSVCLLIF